MKNWLKDLSRDELMGANELVWKFYHLLGIKLKGFSFLDRNHLVGAAQRLAWFRRMWERMAVTSLTAVIVIALSQKNIRGCLQIQMFTKWSSKAPVRAGRNRRRAVSARETVARP